jgi:hypothetical protein
LADGGVPSSVNVQFTNLVSIGTLTNPDPMFQTFGYIISDNPAYGNELVCRITGLPDGIFDLYVYAHGAITGAYGSIHAIGITDYGVLSTAPEVPTNQPWVEGGSMCASPPFALLRARSRFERNTSRPTNSRKSPTWR